MMKMLTHNTLAPFLRPELAERVAAMLQYLLKAQILHLLNKSQYIEYFALVHLLYKVTSDASVLNQSRHRFSKVLSI